jgi:hypothetical protein
MPIEWEQVVWVSRDNLNPNYTTASFETNMPPTPALAKVYLNSVEEFGYPDWMAPGRVNVSTLLFSFRRRKPDGSDETISFPTSGQMNVAWYDDNMTSVTWGAIFASAAIEISVVIAKYR